MAICLYKPCLFNNHIMDTFPKKLFSFCWKPLGKPVPNRFVIVKVLLCKRVPR